MHVLVTGGGGFVGSYAVAAMLDRGHDTRLLVRTPAKAHAVLAARGIDESRVELVTGDTADADRVRAAADGCDATLHAAASIAVTSGGHTSVLETNTVGAHTVVQAALDAGHDPVVHISSVAVFVPPTGPLIRVDSPLGSPRNDYGRSKVATEHELRELQAAGRPVTIVYPGGVMGPDPPGLDATIEGIVGARKGGWPKTAGGVNIVDVRDLADVLAAAITPGAGPRRLLVGGTFLTWARLGALLDELTGVRARRVPFPRPVLVASGMALDALRRIRPIAYPLTRDAAELMTAMVPTDDAPTLAALGVTLRPVRDTLEDTMRSAAAAGHLPAKHAGRLAP